MKRKRSGVVRSRSEDRLQKAKEFIAREAKMAEKELGINLKGVNFEKWSPKVDLALNLIMARLTNRKKKEKMRKLTRIWKEILPVDIESRYKIKPWNYFKIHSPMLIENIKNQMETIRFLEERISGFKITPDRYFTKILPHLKKHTQPTFKHPEWIVFRHLIYTNDYRPTLIAQELGMSQSRVSKIYFKLTEEGILKRTVDISPLALNLQVISAMVHNKNGFKRDELKSIIKSPWLYSASISRSNTKLILNYMIPNNDDATELLIDTLNEYLGYFNVDNIVWFTRQDRDVTYTNLEFYDRVTGEWEIPFNDLSLFLDLKRDWPEMPHLEIYKREVQLKNNGVRLNIKSENDENVVDKRKLMEVWYNLTKLHLRVLNHFKLNGEISIREVEKRFEVNFQIARKIVNYMKENKVYKPRIYFAPIFGLENILMLFKAKRNFDETEFKMIMKLFPYSRYYETKVIEGTDEPFIIAYMRAPKHYIASFFSWLNTRPDIELLYYDISDYLHTTWKIPIELVKEDKTWVFNKEDLIKTS